MSGSRFLIQYESELRAAARNYWQYGTDAKAQYVITHLVQMIDRLTAERDALQAKVDAVRNIHTSILVTHNKIPWCKECDRCWDCPTIRALGEPKEGT